MGHEGLLVLISIVRTSAPVQLDVRPLLDDKSLAIDFTRELPVTQLELDLHLELRDSSAEGDWARQEDFELAVTWSTFAIALNNHFLVRNTDDAQVVASATFEF